MTFEYVLYLFLGVATTATEIALVSSYYRIKGEIMHYPLFIAVATLFVGISSVIIPNFLFSKIILLIFLFAILSIFSGKIISPLFYSVACILSANNGLVSAMLFSNNPIFATISNCITNVVWLYLINLLNLKLEVDQSVKKIIFLLACLTSISFSILFYFFRSV